MADGTNTGVYRLGLLCVEVKIQSFNNNTQRGSITYNSAAGSGAATVTSISDEDASCRGELETRSERGLALLTHTARVEKEV